MAETEVRGILQAAQAALERGRPQETITACTHVRQQYPDAITALRLQGEAFLEIGRVNEARQAFERVLELDPYNVLAHIGLAVIAEDRGEIDRAIGEFRHAWELDPALPQLRNELTRLQRKRHGTSGPVRLTRAALANLHARNEALLRAIREYRALLEEQPARADLSLGLVEAHWRRGDDAEAAALCRQVLAAQPQTARALLILADIVGRRGHADEAGQLLDNARAVDPDAELARALAALRPDATALAAFAEEPVQIAEVEATAAATGAATGTEGALSWEAISSTWGQDPSAGGDLLSRETADPFAMPAGEGGRLFAELDHELTGTGRPPSEPGTQDVAPFDLTEYDIFGPEPGPARSAQGAQASGAAQPPPDDLDELVPTTSELSAVDRLMANWDNIDSELEAARPRDDAAGDESAMLGAVGDDDIAPFDFAAAAQPAEPAATAFDPSNFPLPPLDDEDDELVTGPLPQAAPSPAADAGWAPSGIDTVLGSAPAPAPQSDELSAVERLTANWDNIDSELEAARPRDDMVLGEGAVLPVGDDEIVPFDFEAAGGDDEPGAARFDPSAFPLPPLDDEDEPPAWAAQPAPPAPQTLQGQPADAAAAQPGDLDDLADLGDLPSLADLGVDVSPFRFEEQRADRPEQSFADLIELDERTGSETPAVRTGLTVPIDLNAGIVEMESVFATHGLDAVRDRLEAEEREAREAAEAAAAGEDAATPEASAADLASMDDLFGRLRQSKEERLQTGDLAAGGPAPMPWSPAAEQGLDDQGEDVLDWVIDAHDGPPGTAVLPSGTAVLGDEPAGAVADPGDDWWGMSRRPMTAPLGAESSVAHPSDEAPAPLAPDVWDVGVGGTSWDTGTSVLSEPDQGSESAPAWDPAPAAQPAMAAPRAGTDQLAALEQQVAANPNNPMARLMLAAAYTGHDPDRALVEYRRLVREADALVPEVIERLQEMVEDGIGGARVHRVLGDAYMKLGQFERAAEEFQRALSPGER